MKWFKGILKNKTKGQSFIELALVFMVLLLMVGGVVELGNLINQYLDIIDSAREGARFANSVNLYVTNPSPPPAKIIGNDVFYKTAQVVWATMNPACHDLLPPSGPPNCPANDMKIHFDPASGDDIVITIFSVNGGSIVKLPFGQSWSRFGNHTTSAVPDSDIVSYLDPTAPTTGFVLVEVFYNYHQLLGLPFFTDVIPNPIPVHTYSIMPYPAAEPTPIP